MKMMNIANKQTQPGTQSGFTLIEVMVVVVILGLLAAVVVPKIMGRQDQAMVEKAKVDISQIGNALNMYKLDNFVYPTTDQGLQALVTKPSGTPAPKNYSPEGYLPKAPIDPWGNPYQYLSPGVRGKIDVYSLGPDGQQSDDDIGNWNLDG